MCHSFSLWYSIPTILADLQSVFHIGNGSTIHWHYSLSFQFLDTHLTNDISNIKNSHELNASNCTFQRRQVLLPLFQTLEEKMSAQYIQITEWSAKIQKQTFGRYCFRVPDALHAGVNCKNSIQTQSQNNKIFDSGWQSSKLNFIQQWNSMQSSSLHSF